MIYNSNDMELRAVMDTAQAMCAAARTAPKARGLDRIVTAVLTGEDQDALAAEMERMGAETGADFFIRDGGNLRAAQAIVLIGIRESKRGLGGICGYCHFADCAECARQGGVCVYDPVDVGIAVGSAAAAAADRRVDNRVLFSAGRAAISLGTLGEGVGQVFGIPLSVSGKSPFFDRKKKTQ